MRNNRILEIQRKFFERKKVAVINITFAANFDYKTYEATCFAIYQAGEASYNIHWNTGKRKDNILRANAVRRHIYTYQP